MQNIFGGGRTSCRQWPPTCFVLPRDAFHASAVDATWYLSPSVVAFNGCTKTDGRKVSGIEAALGHCYILF